MPSARRLKFNRLTQRIREARRKKRKLLCVYITLGYTSVEVTERLIQGFDQAGVDILELGFPFSDPLADGPTIQAACQHALKRNPTVDKASRVVKQARIKGIRMPIIFFSYLNPIFRYGVERFARTIADAGFDGVIIPDLPPDEDPRLVRAIQKYGLSLVNLAAPTTSDARMKYLSNHSRDFVYYVSRRGVTGERKSFEEGLKGRLKRMKSLTKKPILTGFGISTPQQAKLVASLCDGVVVGSVFVTAVQNARGRIGRVIRLARQYARAVHRNGAESSRG